MFLFILVLAAGLFAVNAQRLFRYITLGYAEYRLNDPVKRIENLLTIGIFQRKIFREAVAGAMHATIFWGFMVLTAGTIEILIQGVWQGFSFAMFLPSPIYILYSFSQDAFAVLVLGAIAFAFYRRLVMHPKRLEGDKLEHTDALIILAMIGLLMLTLLLANAFALVATPGIYGPEKIASHLLAIPLGVFGWEGATLERVFWWVHVLL